METGASSTRRRAAPSMSGARTRVNPADLRSRLGDYDVEIKGRPAAPPIRLNLPEPPRPMPTPPPEDRPHSILSRRQAAVMGGALLVTAAVAVVAPIAVAFVLNALVILFFTAANLFKLWLIRRSAHHPCAIQVPPEAAQALTDEELPVYTILVPLYHEAEMVPQLIGGIDRLDYPSDRLDVKILLEEDDTETRSAVIAAELPDWFEVLTVPGIGPKGKPRACNAGLSRARGEYLVIYDAEDRPEPDQLRKVVAAFRSAGDDLVCIQAKLNYYNRDHNLLTRWFTAEYSMWFDQLLPGLQSIDVAIPLGGTSNHFATHRLRALGGWNAFNVTEDADLGVRVFVAGLKTAVIDSTTFEEANSRLGNWIRQRSRWVKGYVQTYLYQMRHPVQLYRTMGWRAFIAFHLFFGAGTLCLLINPIYLALMVVWFAAHPPIIQTLFGHGLLYIALLSFLAGNGAFTLATVSGCYARRNYEDVKYAVLAPVYWILMSVAACKGVAQLVFRPYYWEKTQHGFCVLTDVTAPLTEQTAEARLPVAS